MDVDVSVLLRIIGEQQVEIRVLMEQAAADSPSLTELHPMSAEHLAEIRERYERSLPGTWAPSS